MEEIEKLVDKLEDNIRWWKRAFETDGFESNEEGSYRRELENTKKELYTSIQQELSKAREEGREEAIHEISKALDTEITRWRSDEDGEFDVLRIGFRYFRSTDADDYYSSIEPISEEDFKDYESI